MKMGKSILFSTELIPFDSNDMSLIKDWWYFMPETGQHIAFYTYKSLQEIAKKYSCNLYSNMSNIHLLTPKKINPYYFKMLTNNRFTYYFKSFFVQKSLLLKDFHILKSKINTPIDTRNN